MDQREINTDCISLLNSLCHKPGSHSFVFSGLNNTQLPVYLCVQEVPTPHTPPQESPPPRLLRVQITEGEVQRDADAIKVKEERVRETKNAVQVNSSPRTKVIPQDPGQSLIAKEWLFVIFIPGYEPCNSLYSIIVTRSVTKSCLTLCDPMDYPMPGFPVLHYFLQFTQTHVH